MKVRANYERRFAIEILDEIDRYPPEASPAELQSQIAERIHKEWCEIVREERIKGYQRAPPKADWIEWPHAH